MSRQPRRKCPPLGRRADGSAKRAPAARGSRPSAPAGPTPVTLADADLNAAGTEAINALIDRFGGDGEVALQAVRDSVESHAGLSNLAFQAGRHLGLADRVAIGVLWHLYLSKHTVEEQVALQGAATMLARFERERQEAHRARAKATTTGEEPASGCGDPSCPGCSPTRH